MLGFELLTGKTPFAVVSGSSGTGREKRPETQLRILKEDPAIPKGISSEVESLLKELLIKDPALRLGSKGGGMKGVCPCLWMQHRFCFLQADFSVD